MCGLSLNKGCCSFRIHCWQKDICPKVSWETMFFLLFPLWTLWHCAMLDSSSLPSSSSSSSSATFIFIPIITLHSSDWIIIDENKQMMKGMKELIMQNEGRKTEGGERLLHIMGVYRSRSLFWQQAILDQSINAAVKVFTSTEGKSFQNWFVITDVSLCVCSAWL